MTYFIAIAGRRWPVETTFKTGKDTLGWDQSQLRTYQAICRHTAWIAIAQLRALAICNALRGLITLPDAAAEDTGPAGPAGKTTPATLTCRFPLATRRCPPAAASPARPASP